MTGALIESPPFTIALICLVGLLCQWIAWATKLPAILFLLCVGILLGPFSGWINPDQLLGDLLFPLVSICVAIILFEGALTLKFEDVKGLEKVVRRLLSLGALITWSATSAACHLLFGFDWPLSLLMGSLVVVTGPTVVVPMLRSVRPNSRISNVLRWEGIIIDPLGALLAVLVYESIISLGSGHTFSHTLWTFVSIIGTGGILGCLSGHLLGLLLRSQYLPAYLHNMATISGVLMTFALSNFLQEESGLLAVTLMGIWLANMRDVFVEDILSFKENLTLLLVSGLFILLAARLDPAEILALGWPALWLLLIIQLVVRPLAVSLSCIGSDLSFRERALIAWIGPRGIVAAAVSAFFALRLEAHGVAGASLLVPLTFIVIMGTVILQGITARPLARVLGVAEPSPRGYLIVGANPVARAIALALRQQGYSTQLCDSNRDNIRDARMEGLATFYGNPVSEYADKHLDLVGMGRLLALSHQRELNALASMRYRLEFGEKNIFTIAVLSEKNTSEKHLISAKHKGRTLFSASLTYKKFSSLLTKGATIRATTLTDNFGFEDILAQGNGKIIPLFSIDKQNRLHVITDGNPGTPEAGWKVISLDYQDIEAEDPQG